MAISIHIARVGFLNSDKFGNVLKKDDPNVTIKQFLDTSMAHRVFEDSTIPTTSGNPTVENYLKAEAANDYVLEHMDQTMIVTYKRTSGGGFA